MTDPFLPNTRVRWLLVLLLAGVAAWIAWQDGLPAFGGEGPLLSLILAALPRAEQPALVWYGVNVAMLAGAYVEWRRIHRTVTDEPVPGWLVLLVLIPGALAGLAAMRDGSPGVLLVYATMAALSFLVANDRLEWVAAGVVLGLAVAIAPAAIVPGVAIVIGALWVARFRGSEAEQPRNPVTSQPSSRGIVLALSFLVGAALWLLVVPALILGWSRNLAMLTTYARNAPWTRDAEMLALPLLALVPLRLERSGHRGAARALAIAGAAAILFVAYTAP